MDFKKNNFIALADPKESYGIDRYMMSWINNAPNIPYKIELVNYEGLFANMAGIGMALSTIQGAYITKRYITGGYQAEYEFKIVYRITASPTDNDARLSADELLNNIADWALTHLPYIGEGLRAIRIEPTTRASLFAMYDNNEEDHQILMKMTYERI